eukprot:TRINITY_DN154_c0_g1_i1.p1 TRINITY_DN154_c0_g1~~TRINITY_DN154_c0_g1_i1.p1  ORF type:complete len:243 (+),score=66.59 TRINITY_DN154_c0_g1_i1:26-730(+)
MNFLRFISLGLILVSFSLLMVSVTTRGWSFQSDDTRYIASGLYNYKYCDKTSTPEDCSVGGIEATIYSRGDGVLSKCFDYCDEQTTYSSFQKKVCKAECGTSVSRKATMGLVITAFIIALAAAIIIILHMIGKMSKHKILVVIMVGVSWILTLIGFILFGANFGVVAEGFRDNNHNHPKAYWGFSAIFCFISMFMLFAAFILEILATFVMKGSISHDEEKKEEKKEEEKKEEAK